jgi:hypothetical protein
MNEIECALFDPAFWWKDHWCFDTIVEPINAPWLEIVEMMSEHIVLDEKNTAPMIGFQHYLPPDQAVETKEKDGAIYTKKTGLNVTAFTALPVDFDDGWAINEAINAYRELEFMLATSYSHQAEGKDRFRMVFPLVTPLPVELLATPESITPDVHSIMPDLRTFFPNTGDDSWTDKGRAVFQSSCPAGRHHLARFHHNEGTRLDWRWLNTVSGTKRPPKKVSRLKKLRNQKTPKGKRQIDWNSFNLGRACEDAGIVIQNRGNWTDIQCPWESMHTNATAKAHSSIRHSGQSWGFSCMHKSHGTKTAYDLKQWLLEELGDGKWRNMVHYFDE